MASIRQVAKEAGTSPATVSRVLNHDSSFSVSPETAARVHAAAAALGYAKPQQFTQTVQIVTTQTHAMELTDPYFRILRLAIEDEAKQRRLQLAPTVRITAGVTSGEELRDVTAASGVILIGGFTTATMRQLQTRNPNIVVISDPFVPTDMDGVYADLDGFTQRLLQQVYAKRPGNVAFIGGRHSASELDGKQVVDDQEVRYQGYLVATKRAGRTAVARIGDWTPEAGFAAADWYLNLPDKPAVVLAASDPLAIGFVRGLMAAQVPKDQFPEIVSFDDSEMASFTTPTLSSVSIPVQLFGENAVRMLAERIGGTRDYASHVLLEPRLVYRESFPEL
jgi:LacI family transcriptional regulator